MLELATKETLAINHICPYCHSRFVSLIEADEDGDGGYYKCNTCGRTQGFPQPTPMATGAYAEPCTIQDDGCKAAAILLGVKQASCLDCPFCEGCIVDTDITLQMVVAAITREHIMHFRECGLSVTEIMRKLGVSARTVVRACKVMAQTPCVACD